MHFSLTNIDSRKAHQVEIDVAALGLSKVSGEVLTASKLQDHNSFDVPTKVQPQAFKGATLKSGKMTLTLPPFSVVVLEAN